MEISVVLVALFISACSASLTIEVPKDFCELDSQSCKVGQCVRYDPRKFRQSKSIVTFIPQDRNLGNVISSYLILLWIHYEHGYNVYLDKASFIQLKIYFKNLDKVPLKTLEDDLCGWDQFGFQPYEGGIAQLGGESWIKGKAIQIMTDRSNINWLQYQGSGKYFKKYLKETSFALEMHTKFSRHAQIALQRIANKVGKPSSKVTFVGVHDRRTDYLEFRKRVLLTEDLDEEYIPDAMQYFREEYEDSSEVVFVYTSDDMQWGQEKLKNEDNIFFAGCNQPKNPECIGRDFALLSSCNHTIVTHGSFGLWAAFLAGGEIHTEYGAIIPEAYV